MVVFDFNLFERCQLRPITNAIAHMVVDAYNNERTLNFYLRNGFKFLYSDEDQERHELQIAKDELLLTRHMFLDLLSTTIII